MTGSALQHEEHDISGVTTSTSHEQSLTINELSQRQYLRAGDSNATTIVITQNRKIPVSCLVTSLIRGLDAHIYSTACQIIENLQQMTRLFLGITNQPNRIGLH